MRYAMIMAGGAGTRLWPMSRKDMPKQLLRFIQRGGESHAPRALLELADTRLEGLIDQKRRYICTAEHYRGAVRELLSQYTDDHVLGEPAARDTVNAVGFAAAILAKEDKDATFAVLTADHVIEPQETFRERMDLGFRLVENDPRRFVTFSIKPTYPATGFGYVERGAPVRDAKEGKRQGVDGAKDHAYHVARFVEKPDKARAEVYVESGDFAWNSGMFVWRASTFLEALERFKPESYEGLMQIQKAWGTKKFQSVLDEIYPTLPKISVDYAVLEPAAKEALKAEKAGKKQADFSVCTVQMDISWLDVGSWPSFAETVLADKQGNRAAGAGTVVMHQCRNTLGVIGQARAGNSGANAPRPHTLALLGLDDIIVVHTPEATLVMPRSKSEELKQIHAMLADDLK
jgi:mannose-1-phosphate guanylyltransferase